MDETAMDVLNGDARWSVEQGAVPSWFDGLPADSVSLVCGSPPYTGARLYLEGGEDLGVARSAEEWAAWMVDVTLAALRVCTGAVLWVVEGQTVDYRWDAAPMLLAADLARKGVCMRRPCYYRRVGIPGSGGPDWFRCDAEIVLCFTRGGKLPWADPTACGHPPRWAPGGAMSHRLTSGQRVNQWGRMGGPRGAGNRRCDGTVDPNERPSHVITSGPADAAAQLGLDGLPVAPEESSSRGPFGGRATSQGREKDGSRKKRLGKNMKQRGHAPNGYAGGDIKNDKDYAPPVLANPGNVVQETYTAQEVEELLRLHSGEFVDCTVGGNQMGSPLAHLNEAPYPEALAERFVRSFCPPGGVCCDPFSGSGTTLAVSVRNGRRFIGADLRPSQVALSRRRGLEETPCLPGMA